MIAVVALLALALTSPQADPQEKPRVPDDSIELTVTGCLKGRVLTTVGRRPGEVERGVYVGERTFRSTATRTSWTRSRSATSSSSKSSAW